MRENFLKEKETLLRIARQSIKSNIPLSKQQIIQLKKLLAFLVLRASNNQTVSTKNLRRLVNKLYKKTLISLLDDEEFDDLEKNLDIDMNIITANEEKINSKRLAQKLSPLGIFGIMKRLIMSISAQKLIDKIKDLRNQKVNYRETPEDLRQRQRNRERVMVRQRERVGREGR